MAVQTTCLNFFIGTAFESGAGQKIVAANATFVLIG
jgi:hypothetical protein